MREKSRRHGKPHIAGKFIRDPLAPNLLGVVTAWFLEEVAMAPDQKSMRRWTGAYEYSFRLGALGTDGKFLIGLPAFKRYDFIGMLLNFGGNRIAFSGQPDV